MTILLGGLRIALSGAEHRLAPVWRQLCLKSFVLSMDMADVHVLDNRLT